jgi:hypothetical protein
MEDSKGSSRWVWLHGEQAAQAWLHYGIHEAVGHYL